MATNMVDNCNTPVAVDNCDVPGGRGPNRISISKADRISTWWRSFFLQASWNYERMQNLGWAFALIPVLRRLYPSGAPAQDALQRHLEFFNTHPYVAAPIIGVTLALEEERANGQPIDDAAIQGVKVGMMGPLAGIGDPVFWFTVRPILGAIAASLATAGSIIAPLFFFIVWNAIRMAFLWYAMELGYKQGANITQDLGGGLLQKITKGASILGMFVMGILVVRWVNIQFPLVVSRIPKDFGAQVNWGLLVPGSTYPAGTVIDGVQVGGQAIPNAGVSIPNLQTVFGQYQGGLAQSPEVTTTLQDNLNQLIPGLMAVLLTFLCMWLLRKKVNPIIIIFGLFALGILGHLIGLL